uniref:Uncharacterized protein n=1 Tax=Arundo donax TaxID=35708 RepID=A0A0A9ELE3_ARUDO
MYAPKNWLCEAIDYKLPCLI